MTLIILNLFHIFCAPLHFLSWWNSHIQLKRFFSMFFVLWWSINVKYIRLVYYVTEVCHFLLFFSICSTNFYFLIIFPFCVTLCICLQFTGILIAAFNILSPIICNLNSRKVFNYYFSLLDILYFVYIYVHVYF